MLFWGTPEGCNGKFYNNYKQADSNILGNPQQHDAPRFLEYTKELLTSFILLQ